MGLKRRSSHSRGGTHSITPVQQACNWARRGQPKMKMMTDARVSDPSLTCGEEVLRVAYGGGHWDLKLITLF